MVPKMKKEAPAPPKAKSEGLERQEGNAERCPQSQKDLHVPYLVVTQDPVAPETARISSKSMPTKTKLDHYAINELPPGHQVNHEKNRRGQHACVHVDVKVNEHQIKQAVTKLWHDVAKVYTLLRPDEEKTCVQLAPDSDTLGVTNQTEII